MEPQTSNARSPFGDWLRDKLTENQAQGRKPDSIRSLARAMGNGSPDKANTAKRSLHKWIAGKRPTDASRYLVAVALEVTPDEVPSNDDEEDDSEMADLFRALMHRIDRVVDEKVDQRLRERVG